MYSSQNLAWRCDVSTAGMNASTDIDLSFMSLTFSVDRPPLPSLRWVIIWVEPALAESLWTSTNSVPHFSSDHARLIRAFVSD
jgi:hypothetical protein